MKTVKITLKNKEFETLEVIESLVAVVISAAKLVFGSDVSIEVY